MAWNKYDTFFLYISIYVFVEILCLMSGVFHGEMTFGANGMFWVWSSALTLLLPSLLVSVLQVSFICVRVFAPCRRTEISTDLPVRGKKFFQFLLNGKGFPLYCMTTNGIHIKGCSGFKQLESNCPASWTAKKIVTLLMPVS